LVLRGETHCTFCTLYFQSTKYKKYNFHPDNLDPYGTELNLSKKDANFCTFYKTIDVRIASNVYQVPGTRDQVPGTRYQVPGSNCNMTVDRFQVPGIVVYYTHMYCSTRVLGYSSRHSASTRHQHRNTRLYTVSSHVSYLNSVLRQSAVRHSKNSTWDLGVGYLVERQASTVHNASSTTCPR
jgi:hypothetical protein